MFLKRECKLLFLIGLEVCVPGLDEDRVDGSGDLDSAVIDVVPLFLGEIANIVGVPVDFGEVIYGVMLEDGWAALHNKFEGSRVGFCGGNVLGNVVDGDDVVEGCGIGVHEVLLHVGDFQLASLNDVLFEFLGVLFSDGSVPDV